MKTELDNPDRGRRLLLTGGALAVAGLWYARRAAAHDEDHHHAAMSDEVRRSEVYYRVPHATLVRQDGAAVPFPQELDDGRPVILDFIFTSCTTICPVLSGVFSQLQDRVDAQTKMVSISIDPEYDTPQRLREYAARFEAMPKWQCYTGSRDAVIAVQKAFNVYRGDKMNHIPVMFLRPAPGKAWVRLEGFPTADDVAREYRRLVGAA
jgi:protein SCO1/2